MAGGRGFTLVEVLVALGLLVMIASLVLPVALTNTTAARAQTAERMLTLAPAVARGEAQRLGRPVALVLLPSEDGQSLRLAVVREPDPESDSAADQRADPDDVSTWPTVDQPQDLPDGTRLWAGELEELEALQEDIAADVETPSALEAAFAEQVAEALPDEQEGESVEAVVLAWFLSDGSAMAGDAAAVRLADGRIVRIRVKPLMGSLELDFQSQDDAADEDASAEDEELRPAGLDDAATPDDGSEDEPEESGFEDLSFEERGFEELGFEDLGSRFDGDEPDEPGSPERRSTTPQDTDDPDTPDTNPEPPQPR